MDLDPDAQSALFAVVRRSSPHPLRRAVQRVAHYFRREMHFDFCQYTEDGNFEHTAFLWSASESLDANNKVDIIGACCFQPTTFTDIGTLPSLTWIWIHPYRRRSGMLIRSWPYFEKRFGRFYVEKPLSSAMEQFLQTKTSYENWHAEWQIAASMPIPPV